MILLLASFVLCIFTFFYLYFVDYQSIEHYSSSMTMDENIIETHPNYYMTVNLCSVENVFLDKMPETVDTKKIMPGNRIILIGQKDQTENGIYYVSKIGEWNRAKDMKNKNHCFLNKAIFVADGYVYKGITLIIESMEGIENSQGFPPLKIVPILKEFVKDSDQQTIVSNYGKIEMGSIPNQLFEFKHGIIKVLVPKEEGFYELLVTLDNNLDSFFVLTYQYVNQMNIVISVVASKDNFLSNFTVTKSEKEINIQCNLTNLRISSSRI